MAPPKKVYWDTCVWLGLLNQVPDKLPRCEYVLSLARKKDVEIWTSALTLAEVFKISPAPGQPARRLTEEDDAKFEEYLEQDFVVLVQVDLDIGRMARRLLRQHDPLKKSPDAIHLAAAVLHDLDEFHTFDGDNILPLNGLVNRADGAALVICQPPEPPPPVQPPLIEYPEEEQAAPDDAGPENAAPVVVEMEPAAPEVAVAVAAPLIEEPQAAVEAQVEEQAKPAAA